MTIKNDHIKIIRVDDRFIELSIFGDSNELRKMLYNAMKSNRVLANVVLDSVLIYSVHNENESTLN